MSTATPNAKPEDLATLSLLETRLRRVEFLLTGSADLDGKPLSVLIPSEPLSSRDTIAGRIQQLQDDLNRLRKLPGPEGDLIRDVESLHAQVPEIFNDPTPALPTTTSDQTTHVFANATLYPETASRLSSLQTLPVPPASQSAHLLDLRPRIDAARSKQEDLEQEARELRERSVRCLEWWVKFGVVGMGELWTEWEERTRETDKALGRLERAKAEREGYI